MEKKNKKQPFLYLYLLVIILIVIFCFWLIHLVPQVETRPYDIYKLSELDSAVHMYYLDYGEIPLENELKQLLTEHDLIGDETIFYSSFSGKEIRYFTSGNKFVFVSPGANGHYDTPEGYEEIKASKETVDDFVKFGYVGLPPKNRTSIK